MPSSSRSIGPTHAEYVLACIAAGKPVMCEKPLAPTVPECEADPRGRGRLRAGAWSSWATCAATTRATGRSRPPLDAGTIGDALILHNVHRNATVGEAYTSFMTMTDSMIHEVDTTRWLLGEEITAVQVVPPKRTPLAFPHLQDPQFAIFTTETGILSTVEFFANCQYGYDVRCELVGSLGTSSMVNPSVASTIAGGHVAEPVPADWRAALRRRPTPPSSRPGSPASSTASASGRAPGRATRPPRWSRSASRP